MRYQQSAVLTSLRRAKQFIDDNTAALGGVNPTVIKELGDVLGHLDGLAVEQRAGTQGSKGETSRNQSLRATLRQKQMAPIAQIARYKLQSVPEFSALTLPSASIGTEALVAAAMAMADAATPHAQAFIDGGLFPTFIDDLRNAATTLKESIAARGTYGGRRSGATAGLAATEKKGRAILRVLDTLVLAQAGDDPQLRKNWLTAKAVQQKPGPSATSEPVPSTGSQPAPTPVIVGKVPSTPSPVATSPVAGSPTAAPSPTVASPGSKPAAA
ncbi:MAG TPA: hypothetical protein VGM82_09400 [Gemmatimonadaceae bacterium]|jgi:hypothetical protein